MPGNDGVSAPPSGSATPSARFVSENTTAEDLLKSKTVGLIHLDDFRKRRAEAIEGDFSSAASGNESNPQPVTFKKKRKTAKTGKPLLSFADDEEEEGSPVPVSPVSSNKTPTTAAVDGEGNASTTLKKLKANPAVKFQPKNMTKAALKREAELKEEFRREYLAMEESVKATEFLLPFVFHNGKDIPGGVIRMKKGESVWLFLDRARKIGAEISTDQRSIRNWARVSVDDLMLVRGDIIVPQHQDFYYFMLEKTLGYEGPLFPHSAEPTSATPKDLSTPSTPAGLLLPDSIPKSNPSRPMTPSVPDAELEGFGDDPSLTKVVDRRWFDKHKHIFPASTWEEFDPNKDYSTAIRKDASGNAYFFR